MMYGIYVYSFQGQFTLGLAYLGVSKYSWQTVSNVFALITGLIAAGLYGNIGISACLVSKSRSKCSRDSCSHITEVAYYTFVEEWANGPKLMSSKGRLIWSGTDV